MARHTRWTLARASAFLCITLLCGSSSAQEYYGVPIEDGGVAFLLDVSGSMDNRGEQLRAAAGAIMRGLADAMKDTAVGKSRIGQAVIGRMAASGNTPPQPSKMEAARHELLHALGSLRDDTDFTIITFGYQAAEWPGGARSTGPASTALARQYVATLSAGGGTPMAEALELGFQTSRIRTLFVVSDGRPTTGDVLRAVEQLQESREGRRMVINTVGIGRDQDSDLLCQLALDNEGVYVRDGQVACTFSPCSADDGIVTFYPPASMQKSHVTEICSSADHPDCTPELVYETMLSEARFQTPTRDHASVTNCFELEKPYPVTIVTNDDGLDATNYTRPGHPSHPGKILRVVKQQGDQVVVKTTGAGNVRPGDFAAIDLRLIDAVEENLKPGNEDVVKPDNKDVSVPDPEVASTPSLCSPGDGIVTSYPLASEQKSHVTRICSSMDHPDCTPKLVYETMLSEARFQALTLDSTRVTNCLELEKPDPVTIVTNDDGLDATNYTRPGHPSHPGMTMRVVKQQDGHVVVETTGAGNVRPGDFKAVDLRLIDAVERKLQPAKPDTDGMWKKDLATPKKKDQDKPQRCW